MMVRNWHRNEAGDADYKDLQHAFMTHQKTENRIKK